MNIRLLPSLRRKIFLLCEVLLIVSAVFGCSQPVNQEQGGAERLPTRPEEVPRISAEELQQKLQSGENFIIVDTRSRSDYYESHIQGAISVPVSLIENEVWQPPPGTEEIFFY